MADVGYYSRVARSITVHGALRAHVSTTACLFLLLLYCSPTIAFPPISRQLVSKLPAARRGRGLAARRAERALYMEGGCYAPTPSPPASAADTAALKAIFAAALIPIPANQPDACTWPGVSCCAGGVKTLYLSHIDLPSAPPTPPTPRLCNRTAREPGLKFPATLSDSIGQLTNLTDLGVSNLWLAGSVPRSFSRLTKMEWLEFGNNCFSGPFPFAIFSSPMLSYVSAARNFFTGGLPHRPAAYAAAAQLTNLDLGNNWLSGPIPAALATLSDFFGAQILLNSNRLSGNIPPALLKKYFALDLSANRLSGDLTGQHIMSSSVRVSGNRLSGNFNTIRFSESVGGIDVSNNLFSGSFPQIVCHRSGLAINFSHNRLTGAVPADCFKFGSFPNGLFLSHNKFSGSLQPFANLPTDITALDLGFNKFTGRIPRRLTNLPQLKYLDLGANALTGPIPAFCQGKQALTILNLAYNALSGPPTPLSSPSCSASLKVLYLTSNRLSGPIPATIRSFRNLMRLRLDNNALTGLIPAGVRNMKRLQRLGLSYNKLSGAIPAVWPARLWVVKLAGNRLRGAVPAALSKLKRGSFKPGNPNLCGTPLPACA